MKNLLYPLVFATAFVATACTTTQSPDIDTPVDPNGKTPISFVGQSSNHPITRAGFTAETQIVMHIRSTKDANNVRETRTIATADIDNTHDENSVSDVKQADAYVRYWDDAYGRDAQLSVFAIAVPGKTYTDNTLESKLTNASGTNTWDGTALSENVAWNVSADQSDVNPSTIANEDLVYSNNIQGNNNQLKFNTTSGKFEQGKLEFKHALSRMTVNLKKGDGYSTTGAFAFATGTNVKVLGVPTSGTLNIETGSWAANPTSSDITKMATTTLATGATYSLMAQMLPGYTFTDGTNTNVLEFTIDDNKYFVTQDMMFDALPASEKSSGTTAITMAQGKNYVFTITVGKSKIINVTAKLENFVNVDATNLNMDNSHISLNFFTSTGTASSNFDLYRLNDPSAAISTGASSAKNWEGNYTDKASLTQKDNIWETGWFFENNKSFYHFRTVNKDTEIKGNNDNSVDDYIEITSGPVASTDPHWGAPFVTNADIKYDTENGYAAIISPAIGATNSTISMTELHMMSNIKVLLQTTTGNDKVTLANAKVYITKFHKDAHVLMGTGLVTPTNDITNTQEITSTDASTGTEFTYAVVPQTLIRKENPSDDDCVGIIIEAGDNQYIVKKLSDITVKESSTEKITYWHPNHSYTYTFTLTKTGIDKLTCTVSNWVNVTADNKNISLED